MIIVLDTNVLSELMKPSGTLGVKRWVTQQNQDKIYISSLTQAEILYGISILPDGKRSRALMAAANTMFDQEFSGKVLAFSQTTAIHYARIASHRRQIGQPISQFDAQIAAICREHSAAIATRNVKDFYNCGITVLNPWET